jgi:hypothetical protein
MEIDAENLKNTIIEMFGKLRALETELWAYRFCIQVATEKGLVDPAVPWNEALAGARTNPALVTLMERKYQPIVDDLLLSIDRADLEAKVLELLRKWQPAGPPQ